MACKPGVFLRLAGSKRAGNAPLRFQLLPGGRGIFRVPRFPFALLRAPADLTGECARRRSSRQLTSNSRGALSTQSSVLMEARPHPPTFAANHPKVFMLA